MGLTEHLTTAKRHARNWTKEEKLIYLKEKAFQTRENSCPTTKKDGYPKGNCLLSYTIFFK